MFVELYPHIGDKAAQDKIRKGTPDTHHCKWLMRDPNACIKMPDGIEGTTAGAACPHNIYIKEEGIFANREDVSDTVERLMRQMNSAEMHILEIATLDPFTATEIMVTKSETNRQQNERQQREIERGRVQSEINRAKANPGIDFESR